MKGIQQFALAVILLINLVKCEELFCETVIAGKAHGDQIKKTVKSYNPEDVFDVNFEAQCSVIGLEANGCYREKFNMSIDSDLNRLHIFRRNSNLPVEIFLYWKIYCKPDSLLIKEEKTTPTENSYQFGKIKDSLENVHNGLDKVQKGVNKAQQIVNKAEQSVADAQTGVDKAIRDIERSELDVAKAQSNVRRAIKGLARAQQGVVDAQKNVEKAQKGAEKAQRGAEKVFGEVTIRK